MAERYFRLSPEYEWNDKFELFYGKNFSKKLIPFEEIDDKNLVVGIIDNGQVNARRLLLVNKDKEPLSVQIPSTGETVTLNLPGKSAILKLDEGNNLALLKRTVEDFLLSKCDRRDHLHCAQISDINKSGWRVFWAPLQMSGHLLHTRMVSEKTINYGRDPEMEDAERLKKAFKKVC